jgi:hypothetical protein
MPSKIYPNLELWYENEPSCNLAHNREWQWDYLRTTYEPRAAQPGRILKFGNKLFGYWFIRQDSNSSNVNKSQSQNECIVSDSLYTQENRQGIEECIGGNNEKGVWKKSAK